MSVDAIATIISVVVAFGALAAFMDRKIDGLRKELKSDMAGLKAELKSDVAEVKTDVAELKAEVKADMASLNDKVFVLATGLRPHIEQGSQ